MEQTLKIEQKLSPEQRLEAKQSLSLKMSQDLSEIMNKTYGNKEDILKKVIDDSIENITDDQLKQGLSLMFNDTKLVNEIVEHRGNLMMLNKENLLDLTGDYLYNSNEGVFETGSEEKDIKQNDGTFQEKQTVLDKLNKGTFNEALLRGERLKKETEKLEEIYKQYKDDSSYKHLPLEILENKKALNLIENSISQIETIKNACFYVLTLKNKDGSSAHDLVKEMVILDKLMMTLSERIQKRFSARFSSITEKSKSDNNKVAFLNTVGEYVLVAMGIISPELFDLRKGYLEEEEYKDLKQKLLKDDVDIDKIFSYYKLSGPGTIFVNRWKTIGIKPCKITDEKIREFITETAGKDGDEILKAIGFDDFFEEIKRINIDAKTVEERKDMQIELRKVLQNKFEEEKTKEVLLRLIKEKWYSKLDMFYKEQKNANK